MNFFKKFNKLNFNDKNKNKKLISLAVTIFGIGLIITGTSAAYLISEYEGKTHTITAASLVLSLPSESNGITLSRALPVSDEVGLASEDSYSFTLENTGELKMDYAIYLKNRCVVGTPVVVDGETINPDICVPNDYVKLALKTGDGEYEIVSLNEDGTLVKGILEPNDELSFEIKLWLSEDTPNDYQGIQNGVVKNVLYYGQLALKGQQYSEEGITNDDVEFKENLDKSGANPPVLATNMIPVYYDGENWIKADKNNKDEDNKWYDYTNKMWANAVTVTVVDGSRDDLVDAEVGTLIPMERINTMWVWIPRFIATGDTANYNGGTIDAPGAFDITFVNNNVNAHDAFTFGNSISGFWMGKFENSSDISCTPIDRSAVGEGCNLNTIRPKVIPNVTSWGGAMVSTYFYDIQKMTLSDNQYGFDTANDILLDTHMLKNSEWGAVAYLSQSIYGRCTSSTGCEEIGVNNDINLTTGYGAPAGSHYSSSMSTYIEPQPYNTTQGMGASTTGNIYGVYDMSGGTNDFVMGVYWNGSKKWSGYSNSDSNLNWHSGFNGWLNYDNIDYTSGVAYPSDSKYYNLYTNTATDTSTNDSSVNPITDYTNNMQHALIETTNWYGDGAYFVSSGAPWFLRGGFYGDVGSRGIFYFFYSRGQAVTYWGSRTSLTLY